VAGLAERAQHLAGVYAERAQRLADPYRVYFRVLTVSRPLKKKFLGKKCTLLFISMCVLSALDPINRL
jgi:hypothetical protein